MDQVYSTGDSARSYAMVYLPQNAPVKIDLGKITGKTENVWWFDVRTGNVIQASAARGNTIQLFTPTGGRKRLGAGA